MFDHKNSHPQLSRLSPATCANNDEWKQFSFHTIANKYHSKLTINRILIQKWHLNLKLNGVVMTPLASLKAFVLDIMKQLPEK